MLYLVPCFSNACRWFGICHVFHPLTGALLNAVQSLTHSPLSHPRQVTFPPPAHGKEHLFISKTNRSLLIDLHPCIQVHCILKNITGWCLARAASGNFIQWTLFTLMGLILAVLILRAIAANNRHSSIWLNAGTSTACVVTQKLHPHIKPTRSAVWRSRLPADSNRVNLTPCFSLNTPPPLPKFSHCTATVSHFQTF